MRPRIIVTRGDRRVDDDLVAGVKGPVDDYLMRLREAGADPIEVSPDEKIPSFDALCLPGGPDVDPARYGQEPDPHIGKIDARRDALELDEVLPLAWKNGVPILAVCRGMQVLNVFLKGTLKQHIGSDHQAKDLEVKPHSVRVERGSRLAETCGTALVVNSRHHQAVDDLGSGLRPVAWSHDMFVEAAEPTDGRWLVAVQWHPERVQDQLPGNGLPLFEAFVKAVAERVPAR